MLGKIRGFLVAALLVAGSWTGVSFGGTIVNETISLGTSGTGGVDWTQMTTGVTLNPGIELRAGTASNADVGTAEKVGNIIFGGANKLTNTGATPLTFTNISDAGQAFMRFEGKGPHTVTGEIDVSRRTGYSYGFDVVVKADVNMVDATLTADSFTQDTGSILNTGTSASSIITTGPAKL